MAVTRNEIRKKVDLIANTHRLNIWVEFSGVPMKGHVYTTDVNKNYRRKLSPNLPSGQLKLWLEGFEEGLNLHNQKVQQVVDGIVHIIKNTPV